MLKRLIDTEKQWLEDRPLMKSNNSDPERVAKLLRNEVTELIEAITAHSLIQSQESLKEIGQEIADIFKYLLSVCFAFDVDLYSEVMEKTAFNTVRFPASSFKTGSYEEQYKSHKQIVKRDGIKQEFYEQS